MIKKATLINENEKLKREIYIWRNIGIGINASVKKRKKQRKRFWNNIMNIIIVRCVELFI